MSGNLPRFLRSVLPFILCLCFALPVRSQGAKRAVREDEHEDEDRLRERAEYFHRGRTQMGESGAWLRYRAYREKMERRAAAQPAETSSRAAAAVPSGSAWVSIGPAPITVDLSSGADFGLNAGRLTSVVVDQKDSTGNTVYVGAAYGGVWKSTNAAAPDPNSVQWTPLIDDQPTLAVGAIALNPADSGTILIGTGETNQSGDSYYGLGILRSTDGGSTWTLISSADSGVTLFHGVGFSKIVFSPVNPSFVVAAASSTNGSTVNITNNNNVVGIYYSTDAGATWTSANVSDAGIQTTRSSTSSVVFHPGLHMWFAAVRHHGLYSSTDGVNFTRLPVQPNPNLTAATCPPAVSLTCPIGRAEIALAPNSNDMYVWLVDENDANLGIYKTGDGGVSWTSLTLTNLVNCGDTSGCGTSQGTYNLELAAVPNGSNLDLYAGAINIFKCTITAANPTCSASGSWLNLTHVYGCRTWGQPAHVHPDQHAIDWVHAKPKIIYFANDGGIYRTLNGLGLTSGACDLSNPFDDLNANLGSITEQTSFSQDPTEETTLLAGSQDNGSQATNSSGGETAWASVNGGDGGFNAIDPNNSSTWYTANTYVSIQRCTSGTTCDAAGFSSVVTSADVGGDSGDFYTPYILDPGLTSHIIVGTCRVWRGPGTGGNMTLLSHNFDTGGTGACARSENNVVSALAAGGPVTLGVGSNVIYAGTYTGRVFVSTTAGTAATTWSSAALSPSGSKISSIAVDTADPSGNTAYAAVMGFGGGHIYKTGDGGQSWSNISGDLPNAPADSVVIDPIDHAVLYAGTDVGVFATTNGGVNWIEWGSGLPNTPVTAMRTFLSDSSEQLRVSTYGRGVWQTDLVTHTLPHFRLSATPTQITVSATMTGQFSVSVIPLAGFNNTVAIDPNTLCGGLPTGLTCSVSSSIASATVPVTVTIKTGGSPTSQMRLNHRVYAFALGIPAFAGILAAAVPGTRRRLRAISLIGAILFALLVGCGGGGGPAVRPPSTKTAPATGNYVLNVVGTSENLNASVNVTVIVQ